MCVKCIARERAELVLDRLKSDPYNNVLNEEFLRLSRVMRGVEQLTTGYIAMEGTRFRGDDGRVFLLTREGQRWYLVEARSPTHRNKYLLADAKQISPALVMSIGQLKVGSVLRPIVGGR